ncbi:MAG: hypothetical protein B7X48_02725 [Acidiphilium sp. 34-60-192]|nr:MAG: hypothetical protein B7X48_02725 [Acidiphilium sp. 34-60-192]
MSGSQPSNTAEPVTAVWVSARLRALLPTGWFSDNTPVLDALTLGMGALWVGLIGVIDTVRAQTRMATASGVFLDLAALDYCGTAINRRAGESAALVAAIERVTGRAPQIFEPFNPTDCGGYSTNTLGYGVRGGYGSLALPYQLFVTAYRPDAVPASHAGGYNQGPGGYNVGPMAWVASGDNPGLLTDSQIYAAIVNALPVNAVAWTRLED